MSANSSESGCLTAPVKNDRHQGLGSSWYKHEHTWIVICAGRPRRKVRGTHGHNQTWYMKETCPWPRYVCNAKWSCNDSALSLLHQEDYKDSWRQRLMQNVSDKSRGTLRDFWSESLKWATSSCGNPPTTCIAIDFRCGWCRKRHGWCWGLMCCSLVTVWTGRNRCGTPAADIHIVMKSG